MSSASPFPSAHGALAPVNPAEPAERERLAEDRAEERISAPRLHAFLNRTLDAISSLDEDENLKIHNSMVKCVAYYDGRWDGEIRNGVWHDNETITGQILPEDNEAKRQVDKLQMEMCRSRIGYMVDAVLKHQAAKREAAEFANHRLQVNQERIETEPFIQAENLSLLLKTTAFRYSFFDTNADSQEQSVELQVLRSMTDGAEVSVCRTCGLKIEPNTPCPYCGDTMQKSIAVPPSESIDVQQKKVSAGRVVTVRPDATMVQLDLNARDVPSSSFVRWRLVLRRCDWEAMYPNQRIPSSDVFSEAARKQAEAQNTPSNSGWDGTENAGGDQFEKIEGELVWLDAKVYQRYRNREPETLGKDKILVAGTLLTDQFPDGVCVTRIGKTILDLYPSNKNKCWTMCVYGLREHALHGSGTTALLGPQDIINEANSVILANQINNSVGRDLLRSGAIEGGQLPRIDQVAYVLNAPDDVNDIGKWAHAKIQPEGLTTDVYAFREAMKGSIQDAAGTSSLSMQGAADLKVLGTATGVEASRDQAVGRMIPNRKLQAFMGTEWGRQVLELERENYTPEVFLELAGKGNEKGEVLYSERGVRTFFNSTVRNDFSVKPVEGSWMPTTPAQEKANATEFGMIAAQMKEAPQSQDVLATIAPMLGVPYSVNEFGAAQRAASMRLEAYSRIAEGVASPDTIPTPETVEVVLSNCPEWARVDPLMDTHDAYLDYYEDWWMSDEGRNADTLLRMVVSAVVGQHKQGIVAQGQEKATMQTAIQAPAMAAADEAAAQQGAEAHEQAEQDLIKQKLGETHLAELTREHEAEVEMELKTHETDEEIRKAAAISRFTPKKSAE